MTKNKVGVWEIQFQTFDRFLQICLLNSNSNFSLGESENRKCYFQPDHAI